MTSNSARRNDESRAALMGMGQDTEKGSSAHEATETNNSGSLGAVVAFQHVLLWCSAYVLASEIYMLVIDAITPETLPTPIALIFAATISIVYIILHNLAALLTSKGSRGRRDEPGAISRWLAVIVLRSDVTIWLVACCINITFTIAKEPYCFRSGANASTAAIDQGTTCIVQRTGAGASLLALLASFALFVLIHKISSPFRAHLFGLAADAALLLLQLPYHASEKRAMYSQMSFQCRSSTSLARHTLTKPPAPFNRSSSSLLPACPDRATLGLGIHTSAERSAASLLAPRPSLSSIRTHTTISSMPPSSPLPPLPVYLPGKHRKPALPQRLTPCYQLGRSSSGRTIRLVVPSPAASTINLPSGLDRSESLSSVYSRSISGESIRPMLLGDTGSTYSASTVRTISRSPLCTMQTAVDLRKVMPRTYKKRKVDRKWSFECESDDSDIDDAATLQARLPAVTVTWKGSYRSSAGTPKHMDSQTREGATRVEEHSPLNACKTRRES